MWYDAILLQHNVTISVSIEMLDVKLMRLFLLSQLTCMYYVKQYYGKNAIQMVLVIQISWIQFPLSWFGSQSRRSLVCEGVNQLFCMLQAMQGGFLLILNIHLLLANSESLLHFPL